MRNAPLESLSDIAESVRYGYTASATLEPVGPHFLRITDIVPPPQIDWSSVPYCKIDERDREKFSLAPGDIVIARTGATVGYAKLIRDHHEAVFASYLVRIRLDKTQVDPGYVGRVVESNMFKRFVLSRVGGAAQPNANAKVLSSFRLPVPPISVQRRIAEVLSAYDDLIENNRRRIQLLEQTARLLYKEWFVHFRFPACAASVAAGRPGHEHIKIKNGFPQGWEKRHLSELVETQYGFTETASDEPIGPKFLRGKDINKTSYIDWSTVPYCPEDKLDFSKYALKRDDILVVRMADPGKVAIVERDVQAVFASYLVRLTRREGVSIPALYLFYVLSDDSYQRFISGASGGSTRKSASAKLLVDFDILIPTPSLTSMFGEQVQPLRHQIQLLLQQNAFLRKARDFLLPRLINGEIDI